MKRTTEKNRHGTEGRTVNVHAGGNGFPRLGQLIMTVPIQFSLTVQAPASLAA